MVRIAIVDDHAVVRAGLCALLTEQRDIVVAAEAKNGKEAVDIVRARAADVMLLDISMEDMGELTRYRR